MFPSVHDLNPDGSISLSPDERQRLLNLVRHLRYRDELLAVVLPRGRGGKKFRQRLENNRLHGIEASRLLGDDPEADGERWAASKE